MKSDSMRLEMKFQTHFRLSSASNLEIVSVTNAEGPPVPIPNTEVKLCSGENTLREAVREDSPMLTYIRET